MTKDRLTEKELEEIETRANAATQGPWQALHNYAGENVITTDPKTGITEHNPWECANIEPNIAWAGMDGGGIMSSKADAEFIAHARTDIPKLVAEIRRLQWLRQ